MRSMLALPPFPQIAQTSPSLPCLRLIRFYRTQGLPATRTRFTRQSNEKSLQKLQGWRDWRKSGCNGTRYIFRYRFRCQPLRFAVSRTSPMQIGLRSKPSPWVNRPQWPPARQHTLVSVSPDLFTGNDAAKRGSFTKSATSAAESC